MSPRAPKSVRRAPRLAEVGGVYTFRGPDGRYGAAQVLSCTDERAELLALEYLAAVPPSAAHAATLAPLIQNWGNWAGQPARCNVDVRVPWWVEQVTTTAPHRLSDACLSFGDWQTAFGAFYRDRFGTRRGWQHDTVPVTVDVGAGPSTLRRDASRIGLGPGQLIAAPPRAVRFDALDALPQLTEVTYVGDDPALAAWLTRRRIGTVTWRAHGQTHIDLADSDVDTLHLEVTAPLTVRVPATLGQLVVEGEASLLTVEGMCLEHPASLRLVGPRLVPPPRGTEGIQCVEYTGVREGNAEALRAYTAVAELTLRGAPGRLGDARGLAAIAPTLRELVSYDLYGLDTAHWPSDWPLLDGVSVRGLRKDDAAALKRMFADVPDVRIAGARSDEWIAANLDNPFRDWEEDAPAFGRAACTAWRKAKEAATAGEAPERILRSLVDALNKLGRKHDIDTLRREQAGEAFFALARTLGVADAQAERWFDGWRDF